ncbi:YveK family protein [Robertmurraya sp. Marseille-Q9965]
MEERSVLQEIIDILKKRLWMIVIVTILITLASILISNTRYTPNYKSTTQILVSSTKQSYENEVDRNLQLINTSAVLIKSSIILQKVIDELNLDVTPADLGSRIEASNNNNSQVLAVNVYDKEAEMSKNITNTLAKVFVQDAPMVFEENSVDIKILSVAEKGIDSNSKERKLLISGGFGFIIGLMLSMLVVLILQLRKTNKVK